MNLQLVADNFLNQLVALQTEIATRDENANRPTMQEVNMQVRLLGSIDKIMRMLARQEKEAAENTQQQHSNATIPLQAATKTNDEQPFPDEVFEECRALLMFYHNADINAPIRVQNKEVNMWWFVYNLYQYCKPGGDKQYIASADTFRKTVNIEQMHSDIAAYRRQLRAA